GAAEAAPPLRLWPSGSAEAPGWGGRTAPPGALPLTGAAGRAARSVCQASANGPESAPNGSGAVRNGPGGSTERGSAGGNPVARAAGAGPKGGGCAAAAMLRCAAWGGGHRMGNPGQRAQGGGGADALGDGAAVLQDVEGRPADGVRAASGARAA